MAVRLVGARHAGSNPSLGEITEDAYPHLPHRVWLDRPPIDPEFRSMMIWCRDRCGGHDGWEFHYVWTTHGAVTWSSGSVWLFADPAVHAEFFLVWA